ncbi:PQQ-binding-like beta-propeller repeat protein [Actinoplanes sp. M2I2]|uniref:outer membrane protein assembly factor BamB family protein n=1 Tax=Actinoplanes sp. M2I2 TaxID=1734444 RepID=UPI00201FDCFF|nr:PQQ-binding-like beta-propeller repeat protein [Actinoplanes sp. M2I2]
MLIDLDVTPVTEPSSRSRRPLPYVVATVAVLLLALLGGSVAPPRPGGLAEVITVPGQGALATLLTAQALYIVKFDGTVEAHPLCPGCPRWTSRAPAGQRLTEAGDTLVIDGADAAVVTVLDARTGALRWRLPGVLSVDVIGGRVAAWNPEDRRLRVHELSTGRVLWSRPASAYTGDEAYVAIVDERGGATLVSAADGREVTPRRALGLPGAAARLAGDQLIVFGGDYLAGYRRDGLTRQWLTRGVAPYQVSACDDRLLCAFGPGGLTVLDRADGSVRWGGANWQYVQPGGVLSEERGRSAVVDLQTGRVVRELGPSAPVGGLRLYPAAGGTTVLGLDGRARGTLPLVLPGACAAAGPYLSCETPNVTYTVWRVR